MSRLILASVVAAALGSSSASPSSAPLVLDTPYFELVPLRSAWSGAWPAGALPSSWSSLPCTAPAAGAPPALFLAADTTAAAPPLALLACADDALLELASGARVALHGAPVLGAGWLATGSSALLPLLPGLSAVAADGTAVAALACSASARVCTATPLVSAHNLGSPLAALVAFRSPSNSSEAVILASGPRGTAAWAVSTTTGAAFTATLAWSDAAAYTAAAYSAVRRELALGNSSKLLLLDAAAGASPTLLRARAATRWSAAVPARAAVLPAKRWLWVTNVSQGWGGELDGLTALAYDDFALGVDGAGSGDGTLWVGSASALNVLYPNGTSARFGGAAGLPVGNITSLTVGPGTSSSSRHIWLGTASGAVLFDPFAEPDIAGLPFAPRVPAAAMGGGGGGGGGGDGAPRWRYLAGPRHLPTLPGAPTAAGSAVAARGLLLLPAAAASAANLHVRVGAGGLRGSTAIGTPSSEAAVAFVLLVAGGVGGFQAQAWTLAEKAALWEGYLDVHIDDGQATDCSYPGFGLSGLCTWGPGANDGLWSSLVVAAEAYRWAVTRAPDALARMLEVFGGMKVLNDATGIPGLIARAAVDPSFPFPSGDDWHHSTALPGWSWLGDASSDEVVGHVMAYPIVAETAAAAGNATAREAAVALLLNLAFYVVHNNFTLVDITGLPTQWGRWDPAAIGTLELPGDNTRSDNRGENSLEILAMLSAAIKYAPAGSADARLFRDAYAYLAYDQGYAENLANLRITAPCDLNYSDDELEFFSFLAFFDAANASDPMQAPVHAAALVALRRAWYAAVGSTRQSIYGVIYLACTGAVAPLGAAAAAPDALTLAIASDVAWNLRSWAIEATDWPTDNTPRLDLIADAAANRFGNADAIVVLPVRERSHQRWNADPYSFAGGSGMGEADPGAFLMAYWQSVLYGVMGT